MSAYDVFNGKKCRVDGTVAHAEPLDLFAVFQQNDVCHGGNDISAVDDETFEGIGRRHLHCHSGNDGIKVLRTQIFFLGNPLKLFKNIGKVIRRKLITEFAEAVETLYVIEDMEPFFEETIKSWGIECSGKDKTGVQGELFSRKIAAKFNGEPEAGPMNTQGIPVRPPVLCPGCPHRGLYYVLGKLKLTVCSDIGCYTLGALPPLGAVDTCVCMGASIGMAHGMEKGIGKEQAHKTVAVLGDSTFCHSGMTGLLNMRYNNSIGTVIIADNSITGMTGHQHNPATGFDIHGNPAPQLNLEKLCEAMGIEHVRVVDPYDIKELEKVLREETARDEMSVIISRRPCALIVKQPGIPFKCDKEKCKNCGMCMKIGCPAIRKTEFGVEIDPTQCVGCGLCSNICPFDALSAEK